MVSALLATAEQSELNTKIKSQIDIGAHLENEIRAYCTTVTADIGRVNSLLPPLIDIAMGQNPVAFSFWDFSDGKS